MVNADTMPAGREMDALMAEKVMSLPCQCIPGQVIGYACHVHDPKPYSTDIAPAWEVVEKMRKDGCAFDSYSSSCEEAEHPWTDAIFLNTTLQEEVLCRAETAPLAICRAALKAAGAGNLPGRR